MDILKFIVVGLAVCTASSALGIGGGVLLLPVMMFVLHFDHDQAAGTGYAVLLPAVAILCWLYNSRDLIHHKAAVWLAVGFAGGSIAGALLLLSPIFPKEFFRACLGFLLVYVGFRFVLSADNDAYSGLLGLAMVVGSWVACITLKCVGRTYRVKTLAEVVPRLQEQPHKESDYYI